MAFTTWTAEYVRAKDALANKTWNEYFLSSVENHAQMRTTYTRLDNIIQFLEWLKMMAQMEEADNEDGAIPFCIGGT
jgi:hypothetical protein